MQRLVRAGLVAGALLASTATPALAAPVTVDLRIEGKDATIYEGPVTTDIRTINLADGTGEHPCDGDTATPEVVRGNALVASGLALMGSWNEQYQSATFSAIGGQDVSFDPATQRFLGEYKNEAFSPVGACSDPIASGDRVLFAYGDGTEKLLKLTGPSSLKPGETADLKVTDAATGAAVAGASVGGQSTGADGIAKVKVDAAGEKTFKAEAPGAIRSNRVAVCATTGADGFCGSAAKPYALPQPIALPPGPPTVALAKLKARYRKRGPRTLRGVATAPLGLQSVKLRLTRKLGRRCEAYSGRSERFKRVRSCARAQFFSIGAVLRFSYLLPRAPSRGSYTLEAVAIDRAGRRSPVARVRFRVR